jgi:hypothetical protein
MVRVKEVMVSGELGERSDGEGGEINDEEIETGDGGEK